MKLTAFINRTIISPMYRFQMKIAVLFFEIIDEKGSDLRIANFPSRNEKRNVVAWIIWKLTGF